MATAAAPDIQNAPPTTGKGKMHMVDKKLEGGRMTLCGLRARADQRPQWNGGAGVNCETCLHIDRLHRNHGIWEGP